jgi:hypothetical protein
MTREKEAVLAEIQKLHREALSAQIPEVPKQIELIIRKDGTVCCNWWTPEIAEILCKLCGKEDEACVTEGPNACSNTNPWCG